MKLKREDVRRLQVNELTYDMAEDLITRSVANGIVKGSLRILAILFLVGLVVGLFRALG